jgi:hypothetical protein
MDIKGARDLWHQRALPGYRIKVVAGPPFHFYALTVVDGVVTEAERSVEPLTADITDLDPEKWQTPLSTTMTTLYNRRALGPFTVVGLFDRVMHYYEDRPKSPACETQVTVRLHGDLAFPFVIKEGWADDCQADGDSPQLAVIAFATLTPTPTELPTATATPTLRPATIPSPSATAQATASSTPSPSPTLSPTAPASPTPLPTQTTSGSDASLWIVLLAGVVIAGAILVRRNGKRARLET